MNRAKLINATATVVVLGSIYAGCSIAAAITGYPPPISGVVVLAIGFIVIGAFDGALTIAGAVQRQVLGWSHRREVARQNALYEHYQIAYRIGSPPSHADRRAA